MKIYKDKLSSSSVPIVLDEFDQSNPETIYLKHKFLWMMDWCRKRMLSPSVKEVWELAEKAYREDSKWINRLF